MNHTGEDKLSDASLMRRLADGDTAALGDIYLRFGSMMAHAAIAAIPSLTPPDVEDICQDALIAVAGSAKQYREQGKLKSWLYSVAVLTARKRHRSQRLHHRLLGTVWGKPVGVSAQHSMPEASTMSRLDLYRAFKELNEIQRQVIVLFEFQGMSGEEVSEVLGINLNTVWSHLRRARKRILGAFDASEGAEGKEK